ncbi:hypothetical protein [Pseudoxanthomonas sp. X-1]|jgi:hypothetical protein|uniref:hypothetical protein n=1 Tax=Pseudoxanthomonas sp. X-1 TaxID=2571115 RepID=UPI000DB06ACF|nr:hypothetical protein [Pseudoxanthomonas sp. X-1]PZP58242.1 MAG: hypothetical protein DI597_19565 [Pseudoxanthomonas spadix]TMN24293.1 hypothetical protein FF950_05680 [Pseudoxanthomonas sp. X-1]UAY73477.1 hypothetical protein LAJ50_13330 [Pseudoxanthomonas sp. X-1]
MGTDGHDCAQLRALAALLAADRVDAALEAGLMEVHAEAGACAPCVEAWAQVSAAQQRLRFAWAARERYRAREARLARRAAERQARRIKPAATPSPQAPALPPAVAAALARAKARAAGTPRT